MVLSVQIWVQVLYNKEGIDLDKQIYNEVKKKNLKKELAYNKIVLYCLS